MQGRLQYRPHTAQARAPRREAAYATPVRATADFRLTPQASTVQGSAARARPVIDRQARLSASTGTLRSSGRGTVRSTTSSQATQHSRATVLINGRLCAVPFRTGVKHWGVPGRNAPAPTPSATPWCPPDPVLNTSRSMSSVSQQDYGTVPDQRPGSARKKLVPYRPNSARNQHPPEWKRMPSPFATTMDLSQSRPGAADRHPYRTVAQYAMSTSGRGTQWRTGQLNPAIATQTNSRLRKGALG